MKKHDFFGICCMLLLFSAVWVHGQGFTGQGTAPGFTGPAQPISPARPGQPVMTNQPITVREAANLPHDSWVVLTGNIINALPGGKHYTFRDSTGEIPVDIGMKQWRGLSVGVSDRVEIYGEVKVQRGQYSIKVHAISGSGITPPSGFGAGFGQAVMVNHPITIGEARNLPQDSWVRLTGNIVNSLPKDKEFTFRDSSGEVVVEIDRKHWRGLSVGASDRVELFGEVKISKGQLTVKVHAIRRI